MIVKTTFLELPNIKDKRLNILKNLEYLVNETSFLLSI